MKEARNYLVKYFLFVVIFLSVVFYVAWANVEDLKAKGFQFPQKHVISNTYFGKDGSVPATNTEVSSQEENNVVLSSKSAKLDKKVVIQAIDEYMKGGKLAGHGKTFYKAYEEWKVSAMMMAAICYCETRTWIKDRWVAGTSPLIKQVNNVAGINWDAMMQIRTGTGKAEWIKNPYQKHGWYNKYDSIEDSIDDMARRLRWWYIDMGKLNITSIQKKWAPDNDDRNGIANMDNSAWNQCVTDYFTKISKRAYEIQGGTK